MRRQIQRADDTHATMGTIRELHELGDRGQSAKQLWTKWLCLKGHSGHPENELADELANKAIDELLQV